MNATTPTMSGELSRGLAAYSAQVQRSYGMFGDQTRQAGLFEQILNIVTPLESTVDAQAQVDDRLDGPIADQVASSSSDDEKPSIDDEDEDIAEDNAAAATLIAPVPVPVAPEAETSSELEGELDVSIDNSPKSATQAATAEQPTQESTQPQSTADHVASDAQLAGQVIDSQVDQGTEKNSTDREGLTLDLQSGEATAEPTNGSSLGQEHQVAPEVEVNALDVSKSAEAADAPAADIAGAKAVRPIETDAKRSEADSKPSQRRSERSEKGNRQKWFERDAHKDALSSPQEKPMTAEAIRERAESQENNNVGGSTSVPESAIARESAIAEAAVEPTVDATSSASTHPLIDPTMVPPPLFIDSSAGSATSGVAASLVGEGETGTSLPTGTSSSTSSGRVEQLHKQFGSESGTASSREANPSERQTIDLAQHEKVRLIQRVARSFNRLGPAGGEVNLRLHPPELGALNVQVRMEERSLTAKLTTENGAAREIILENLPVLKSRLAEQGIEVAQFQVDVAENGNADAGLGRGNDQAFERRDGSRHSSSYYNKSERSTRTLLNEPVATSTRTNQAWLASSSPGIDVQA